MATAAPVHVSGEMFVQVARGMRSSGQGLVLLDLAPSTIHLTLAPTALLGYLATGEFLDRWEEHAAAFAAHPPQATLSLLDASARLVPDVVVRLRNPRIRATGLTYDADLTSGVLPSASGACVLFIDTLIGSVGHVQD